MSVFHDYSKYPVIFKDFKRFLLAIKKPILLFCPNIFKTGPIAIHSSLSSTCLTFPFTQLLR
jgi:hypothetical protein